jgi:hypothetical protein
VVVVVATSRELVWAVQQLRARATTAVTQSAEPLAAAVVAALARREVPPSPLDKMAATAVMDQIPTLRGQLPRVPVRTAATTLAAAVVVET